MIEMDLKILKDSFLKLIISVDQQNLAHFVFWLDLKIAEYKVTGFISNDVKTSPENSVWIDHATRRLFDSQSNQTNSIQQQNHEALFNGQQKSSKKRSPHINILPKPNLEAAGHPDVWNIVPVGTDHTMSHKKSLAPINLQNNQGSSIASSNNTSTVLQEVSTPPRCSEQQKTRFLSYSEMKYNRSRDHYVFPIDHFLSSDANAMDLHARHMSSLSAAHLTDKLEPLDFSGRQGGVYKETAFGGINSLSDPSNSLIPRTPNASEPGHTGEVGEKINCLYCSKSFMYRSSYRRHIKIHQGIFSHTCMICGRKFTRKEHFDRHKCDRKPNKPNRASSTKEEELQAAISESFNSGLYQNFPTTVSELESENYYNTLGADFSSSRRKSHTPRKLQKTTLKNSNGGYDEGNCDDVNHGSMKSNINDFLPAMVALENASQESLKVQNVKNEGFGVGHEHARDMSCGGQETATDKDSSDRDLSYLAYNICPLIKNEPKEAESPIELARSNRCGEDLPEDSDEFKFAPETSICRFASYFDAIDSNDVRIDDQKLEDESIEYCDINMLMTEIKEPA